MEIAASKKKQAYDEIKRMIIENEVEKETPLVERTLCDILGISRTPVREALRELASALTDLAIEDAASSELIQVEADSAIETILEFADLGDLLRLIAWAEAEGVTVNMYLEDLACMAYEGQEWPEAVKAAMSARRRCEEPRTGEEGEAV